jgi:hypothetical protein
LPVPPAANGPAVAAAALAVTQAARPAPACRGVLASSCHLAWRGTTPRRCITPTHHHRPPRTGGAAAMGGSITSSNVAGGRERLLTRWRPGGSSIPVWHGASPLPLLLLDDSSSPCQLRGAMMGVPAAAAARGSIVCPTAWTWCWGLPFICGGFRDRHKAAVWGDRLIYPAVSLACSCAAVAGSCYAGVCLYMLHGGHCMRCRAGVWPVVGGVPCVLAGRAYPTSAAAALCVFLQQQASGLVCLVWVWARALPTLQQSSPCACCVVA